MEQIQRNSKMIDLNSIIFIILLNVNYQMLWLKARDCQIGFFKNAVYRKSILYTKAHIS